MLRLPVAYFPSLEGISLKLHDEYGARRVRAAAPGMTGSALAAARVAALCLLAAGCSTLPSSGPTSGQIQRAVASDNTTGFSIVDIDLPLTKALAVAAPVRTPLAQLARDGRTDTLGPGDVLAIEVYEVGVTLFSRGTSLNGQSSTFSPSATSTTLTSPVDGEGFIQLPYVGRINVLGKSTGEVEHAIEQSMMGLSQRAQVQVTVRQNAFNVFYVLGDVRNSGRFELGLPRQRLLDAIARAGGSSNQPNDVVVRLTRDGRSFETRLSAIDTSGPQNILLLPGDRVELFNRPRTFLVFGSTERVAQVAFGADQLSIAEALARIGGPAARSADPSAIYIFRWPQALDGSDQAKPVVYRLDLRRADGFFLSQRFEMQDKDVIYIAGARSNALRQLTEIAGLLFGPVAIARSVTN